MTHPMETHSDDLGLPDDRARQLLAFATAHPNLARAEESIRRELGLTPARYIVLLHRLINTQQALDIDPMLTRRLRRLRDAGTAEQARRLGHLTTI